MRLPTAESRLRFTRLTDARLKLIDDIVCGLEKLKLEQGNQTIIPSLKFFAATDSEFIDLLSRNTTDSYASLTCSHLINKRTYEIFESKISSRYDSIRDNERVQCVILELTVDKRNR